MKFGSLKRLIGINKHKPKQELSFFDKLVDLCGSNNAIEVYNGITYSQSRISRDGAEQPLKLGTDKWFKIKIGKYVSGYGDWGGGFSRAECAVAEVYVNTDGKVLHVCACDPYYNSPTKENETEKIKAYLSGKDYVKLETRDKWLTGVLDTIHKVVYIGEANLWKHPIMMFKEIKC